MKEIIAGLNDTGVEQFEEEIPILNLPTDYPRPLSQSYEANNVKFELDREETLSVKTLAAEQGVTLDIILLAICNIWLAKLSTQEDIVIGTPITGKGHEVRHDISSMFENTLALRNFPAAEKTIINFLKEVNERTLAAFREHDYPFADVLGKFALHRDSQTSICDLNLEFFESNDQLLFILQYSTKLFKEETARRFAGYFKNIINSIIENPGIRISAVEIMGKEEQERMLEIAAGIIEPCDLHETVHGMFEKAAAENEAKIALVFRGSHMSYGKLNRAANQLAIMLRNKGVGPGWVVGLMVERSFYMIIGILGILKAGGAYLPIDPKLPGQRKRFMIEDGNVKILLTGAETGETLYNSSNIEQIDIKNENIYRGNTGNLANMNKGSDLLYVIFTSGSTGRPKGVMLQHTNLVNLITFHYKHTDIDCSKVLQFVTMSFDVSYQEIFAALLAGGELYLIDEETRINIPALFDIIAKNKIKTLFLPMSFLKMIFSQEGYIERFPGSVGHIITAGEQAVVNQRFGKYLKEHNIYFYNHYGPSETHVITTFTMYQREDTLEFPPIGKPIMNTIIYILDVGRHLQPVGIAGELVAGGLQVGKGYMNNIQLTSEKFIILFNHHLPLTTHHSPLYRTGDLARWLPDGNIEFLGRIDQQVKIRGFRVELGEIENELVKHKDIKDAVVIPRKDETGDKYLCVYYVPHHPNTVNVEELTTYLSRNLPGYMVPLHFLALEKIPLTASGKVDRRALPHPESLEAGSIYVAPGNEMEEKLAELWSQVLGVSLERIGVDDHFFQVGGQSLKAAMLIAQIHSAFNVNLPLVEFFESPTIRGQARYIKEAKLNRCIPIEAMETKEYYDLSPAQKRLFIMHQMEAPYSVDSAWRLKGQLNKNRLEAAVQQLIRRHDSLRTSFLTVENEPVQKIHSDVDFKIEFYDLAGGEQETVTIEKILQDFVKPFDLSCAPLLRAGLIRTDENTHIFMVDIHHIVSDGLSLGIFIKEFMVLYQGRNLPALRLQYKDYCQWWKREQQQGTLAKQEEYWLKLFEAEAPVLELAYDYPRPVSQSFEGRTAFFYLDKEETGALKRFVSGESSTPTLYMVLLALFNVLLAKLSGNEDIAVGTPAHGRKHMDLQSIIGMFVVTLPMRFNPVPDKTIAHFIREVKELSLAAFENQDYPFEKLVEKVVVNRDRGRNPLFDVMFAVQDSQIFPNFELTGLSVKPYERDNGTAHFDIFWQVIEGADTLTFALNYCTKLFNEETINQFFIYFKKIVSSAIEDSRRKIGEIEIITGEEKKEILYGFNNTQTVFPGDKTIQRLFEEQVERVPDQIAIAGAAPHGVTGNDSQKKFYYVTYRKSNENAGRLAELLIEKGVRVDDIIGIMMERSIDMIIGILGILKSQGAYLPIDPFSPQERIDYMLKDSSAKILIIKSEIRNPKSETNPNVQTINDQNKKTHFGAAFVLNFEHLNFEHLNSNIVPCFMLRASKDDFNSSNLAYVIYTSGSTGRPKGVMVAHRNVINLVFGLRERVYSKYNRNLEVALVAPYIFDASVKQIFGALLLGYSLYIVPEDVRFDGEELFEYYMKYAIDVSDVTPSHLRLLIESRRGQNTPLNLKSFLIGGEPLTWKIVAELFAHFETPSLKITNVYGPTECCVDTTTHELLKENIRLYTNVPIGVPMPNQQVFIVGKVGNLQPIGVPGQLCIGGNSVSRGYLNNPELTAKRFKKIVISNLERNDRLYCTGDLARWLPDGNIEFLDRIDQQVKIRGFRVELGEIENELNNHKDVKDAVVIPLEDETGAKYLCAYYVPHHQNIPKREDLTACLSQFLPGYMIPLYFLAIEKIPLNVNGKVDRKALPRPGPLDAGSTYTAPRDKMEEKLVELWSQALGAEQGKIGIDNNFFHLGGQSLKLFILTAMIHKEFNVKVPMSNFFEISSVRGQVQYIKQAEFTRYTPIEPVETKEYYELSPAQKRLFIMHQMEVAYNLDSVWTITGRLDKHRLDEAFHQLIRRHESLRTSFFTVENEPMQKIHRKVDFKIEFYDLGDGEQGTGGGVEKILHDFLKPFDLSRAPLLRAGLIPTGENEHIFMLDIHHIVSDGLSLGIFIKEFMALYQGSPLPALRLQYKDYCQWRKREQQQGLMEKQEEYWLKLFETEVPILELPYDYPRPVFQGFEGRMMFFQLDWEETGALKRFVSGQNSTPTLYMVLLALFNILLAKLSGNEDIVVGTPVHGRKHMDLQPIIGMFVGTLALRNYPAPGKTITQFIREVKEYSLAALENQDYPFEELVEKAVVNRDTGRNPLFDVMFALQDNEILPCFELKGLNMEPYEHESRVAYFDLFWEAIERAGALAFNLYYCKKLFNEETLNRFFTYFKKIVSAVIKNPRGKIGEIEIITGEEKREILYDFNETQAGYPREKTIHRLFEEQVERTPDDMAVVEAAPANCGCPLCLTYRELNEKSHHLAGILQEKGVYPNSIVGLMMERSIEIIIGILGILKAGGAYLPIDPEYPEERVDYILKDSGAKILIMKSEIRISKLRVQTNPNAQTINDQNKKNYFGAALVLNFENLDFGIVSNFGIRASDLSPSNLAYIIYTSGSSGKPKGVLVEHSSVVNVLFSLLRAYPSSPADSFLLKTSFLFDVSVAELFCWFLGGSRLIVPGKNDHKDPQRLSDIIERETVTHINFVPSMFSVFISQFNRENIKRLSSLRYIFLAGEALPPEQVAAFRELNNKIVMENLYGPTENTVYTSKYSLTEWSGKGSIPIGKPLSNMQLYIVDRNGRLQPIGVSGELCISGVGLARGYLNNPELTGEKFKRAVIRQSSLIISRSSNLSTNDLFPNDRLYKTGDLARWLTNGNIEFLGRSDQQVKIRGYRIELGEIENRLRTHETIKDAIVIERKDKSGDKYLCAYIVFKVFTGESDLKKASAISRIRDYLAGKLPGYMIPAHFATLESIPLTTSGKVDRKALPATEPGAGSEYTAPRDEMEERLAEIWSEVLGISKNKIGIDYNFFQLGGQSLKLVMLIARIHKEFDVKVLMSKFFEISSVRAQAQYIKIASPDKYSTIEPVEKKDYYPMAPAQKRMYILQEINPDSINYNMPLFTTLAGLLEKSKLENAFRELIYRHDSLRTSFHMVNSKPVQRVHDEVTFEIDYYKGNADAKIIKNFVKPFDLSQAPFLRVGLLKTQKENHLLLVDMHHSISDGRSFEIFLAELLALYREEKMPGLRLQYKDFAEWLEKPAILNELRKQEAYWLNRLTNLPVLKLPTDYPRPEEKTYAGAVITFEIHGKAAEKLRALATAEEATLFMVILTIFNILLFKLGCQEDIALGTLVTGRRCLDLEYIIGMFVNTLVLRNHPGDNKNFKEFLKEVKKTTLEAFDRQDYPFDDLVEKLEIKREPGRNPLFDVLFLFNSVSASEENKLEIPGLKIKPLEEKSLQAKFDLLFTGRDSGENENLFFVIEYSTELFKKEQIERFITYFKEIISAVTENEVIVLKDIEFAHGLARVATDFNLREDSGFEL